MLAGCPLQIHPTAPQSTTESRKSHARINSFPCPAHWNLRDVGVAGSNSVTPTTDFLEFFDRHQPTVPAPGSSRFQKRFQFRRRKIGQNSAVFGRTWTKRLLSGSRQIFAPPIRQCSRSVRPGILRRVSRGTPPGNASISAECRSQSLRLGVTFSSITALTPFAATNGIKRSNSSTEQRE